MSHSYKQSITFGASKLFGSVVAPPSKSDAHRAIFGASLCTSPLVIHNIQLSDDILATLNALKAFGMTYQYKDNYLVITPSALLVPEKPVFCNESGSTLRFLLPLVFLVDGQVTFEGAGRLVSRPLDAFIDLLDAQGMDYTYKGKLPISIVGGGGLPEHVHIDGSQSSQPLTGLLFCLASLGQKHTITVDGNLSSKYYIDMTLDTLLHYGINVAESNDIYTIEAGQSFKAKDYTVEGDFSNAAFWMVAGTLCDGLTITGLNPESKQGDKAIVDLINQMGGSVTYENSVYSIKSAVTFGIDIDVTHIVDLAPILCVLASISSGKTVITGASRLRHKESNRIKSMVDNLSALGAKIKETQDGMVIEGVKKLHGAVVDSYGDHRIAMAMAIASLVTDGDVVLRGKDAVNKSYPHFYEDFKKLGGIINE